VKERLARAALLAAACVLAACTQQPAVPAKAGIEKIAHIVVIYLDRSFDNLYGLFPGADGIANATPGQYTQLDYDGKPLPHLPPVWKGAAADLAFPNDLPNKPFRIDAPPINMPLTVATRDLIHKLYPQQEQIDAGKNNRFVSQASKKVSCRRSRSTSRRERSTNIAATPT
jgi:phospholipase C